MRCPPSGVGHLGPGTEKSHDGAEPPGALDTARFTARGLHAGVVGNPAALSEQGGERRKPCEHTPPSPHTSSPLALVYQPHPFLPSHSQSSPHPIPAPSGRLVIKDHEETIVLRTGHILIHQGGELHAGSTLCPFQGNFTILLYGRWVGGALGPGPLSVLREGGFLDIHLFIDLGHNIHAWGM